MKLLVVRPQPGADATTARLLAAGHQAILMPLFDVQPVGWDVPLPVFYDALLLTSGNAVRQAGAALDALRDLPVVAVGSATSRAAKQAGLHVSHVGDTGVADLLGIAQAAGHRRLLWLAGEDHITVSAPDGVMIDTCIVYRSAALAAPKDFATQVRAVDAILLHSPRAALHFTDLCNGQAIDRATLTIATLSAMIAKTAGFGWKQLVVAAAPNDESLLSALQSCFTNGTCDPYLPPTEMETR